MNFMYFLANLLGPLMKLLYGFIGNYGITIIVATVVMKLLLFPLAIHQQKSTAKMSVFQPLINEIQTKYKNNPEKQQEELMKLQQEHGYNPMSGCLPMLLTMLVLFGFLGVVYYPVHYIFGVSDAVVKQAAEAIGLATTNVSTMQTAQMQGSMKIMMLVMNLMFVTFCFNAPIGFSIYYSISNVLQLGQSVITYKIYSPEKFKKQYEEEIAAKRAERKKKQTVTVQENGKDVTREVGLAEANKLRLEEARRREAELYKDERTTPLHQD